MSAIILLDTSVYLNVLNIPGRNQQRQDVLKAFERSIEARDYLLLPVPAIWETGNHVSRLSNGGLRFQYARLFVDDVGRAINGETPYSPT